MDAGKPEKLKNRKFGDVHFSQQKVMTIWKIAKSSNLSFSLFQYSGLTKISGLEPGTSAVECSRNFLLRKIKAVKFGVAEFLKYVLQ